MILPRLSYLDVCIASGKCITIFMAVLTTDVLIKHDRWQFFMFPFQIILLLLISLFLFLQNSSFLPINP